LAGISLSSCRSLPIPQRQIASQVKYNAPLQDQILYKTVNGNHSNLKFIFKTSFSKTSRTKKGYHKPLIIYD
jgi:hypothetical protein